MAWEKWIVLGHLSVLAGHHDWFVHCSLLTLRYINSRTLTIPQMEQDSDLS
jgi:hypothetical protein